MGAGPPGGRHRPKLSDAELVTLAVVQALCGFTSNETGPVSPAWMAHTFGGLGSTLEQLRVDRQLDEALTRGPDLLHLAAVFDIDAKTAVRYANNARQLLPTGFET